MNKCNASGVSSLTPKNGKNAKPNICGKLQNIQTQDTLEYLKQKLEEETRIYEELRAENLRNKKLIARLRQQQQAQTIATEENIDEVLLMTPESQTPDKEEKETDNSSQHHMNYINKITFSATISNQNEINSNETELDTNNRQDKAWSDCESRNNNEMEYVYSDCDNQSISDDNNNDMQEYEDTEWHSASASDRQEYEDKEWHSTSASINEDSIDMD